MENIDKTPFVSCKTNSWLDIVEFAPKIRNMNIQKVLFASFLLAGLVSGAHAQQVSKNVIAEHFTNTLCSVCASRNPGLTTNLANYPQVLHVSFHPSAPYAGCTLSMANVSENDARTNYYGLYGATPQLTIQGKVITGSFTNPAIFTDVLGELTSFSMSVTTFAAGADSLETTIKIKKVDTSSLTMLQLYGLVAEDTLFFTSGNGETYHYNVFRKSIFGNTPLSITSLVNVGDSFTVSKKMAINSSWTRSKLFSTAIIQDNSKSVVQAGQSGHLPGIPVNTADITQDWIRLYPNPATNQLYVDNLSGGNTAVSISDAKGGLFISQIISDKVSSIDISNLSPGLYFVKLSGSGGNSTWQFIKL